MSVEMLTVWAGNIKIWAKKRHYQSNIGNHVDGFLKNSIS
jgi:hypothetical protein